MDFPHGFDLDDEGNVWASDQRGHRVFKWDAEGELLMTIGERGTEGDPPRLLTQPTDLVVAPNGNVFVTEGHGGGGNRVSKFSSDGRFIMSWGTDGLGRRGVHCTAYDRAGFARPRVRRGSYEQPDSDLRSAR